MDDHDRLLYETAEKVARLSDASRPKSASTHRAYNSDWRHFERWCQENGLNSLPAKPSSIAQYVDYLTRPGDGTKPSKPATISRRLCSINAAHKAAQLGSPATMNQTQLSQTLHDLRQAFATQRQVRKRPITPARIARILDSLDGSIAAVRNRALLLIGVAGALGNSELAAIRIESLKWNEKGLAIDLPHAIDDGETQTVEIPFATDDQPCAVKVLKDWLAISNLQEGKVFRSLALSGAVCQGIHPNSIGRLVQGMVRKAQIYSPQSYGGHSLRIGNLSACVGRSLLTQAAKAKEDIARKRPRVDRWDRRAAAGSLGLQRRFQRREIVRKWPSVDQKCGGTHARLDVSEPS